MVVGAVLGYPVFALDVQWEAVSGGCHYFHWCCRGCRVFVAMKQKNHNTLHANMN